MTLQPWHWVALGAALAIAEIFVAGTVLLWTGIAALVLGTGLWASDAAGFGRPDGISQCAIFAALAVASVALGLRLRRRPVEPLVTADVNIGSARHIGLRTHLATAIADGHGTIRIGDAVWQVVGPDLPAGAPVVVTGSDGITLRVDPAG